MNKKINHVGEQIEMERERQNLTQTDLADIVNEIRKKYNRKPISQQHIGLIERTGDCTISTATELGEALDVSLTISRTSKCDICKTSVESLLDVSIKNKLQIVRELRVCPVCQTSINRHINQMLD